MSLDWGPQYHPPELISWDLMGSRAQIEQAAAGQNWLEVGAPTYPAGYFGGGMYTAAGANGVRIPNYLDNLMNLAGCVEWWQQTNGWNINNGIPTGNHRWVLWGYRTVPTTELFDFGYQTINGIYWRIWRNGVAQLWGVVGPGVVAGFNVVSGDWHHVAIVWDSTGIGGGANTGRLYLDGVQMSSTNNAIAAMPILATPAPATDMDIGRQGPPVGGFPFTGTLDNLKWWNYAKTDFTDRFDEGFTPPPGPSPALPGQCPVPTRFIAEIGGHDVADRMDAQPTIEAETILGSEMPFPDDCTLTLNNHDRAFSLDYDQSLFADQRWRKMNLVLTDQWFQLLWYGPIVDVDEDVGGRVVKVTSRSPLDQWKDQTVVYTSAAPETPAEALQGIFAAVGFETFDAPSLSRSVAQQQSVNLSIIVTLTEGDNVKLPAAIEALARYGVAEVWNYRGLIFYEAKQWPGSFSAMTALTRADLIGDPKITNGIDKVVNDYAIYESGTPSVVTDATQNNLGATSRAQNGTRALPGVAGEASPQWDVQDIATARWIGEQWMHLTHLDLVAGTPRRMMETALKLSAASWVDLKKDVTIEYSPVVAASGWRIVGYSKSGDKKTCKLKLWEWEA
jgi:hypothetical protein